MSTIVTDITDHVQMLSTSEIAEFLNQIYQHSFPILFSNHIAEFLNELYFN